MNAKTIAELALKLWGVTSILGAVLAMPAALWMVWSLPSGDPQAAVLRASQSGYLLNTVVQLVGGIAVLVWADGLVASFEADDTPLHVGISSIDVSILAFAIAGVFVFVDGLQNLLGSGYVLWMKPSEADAASYMWALTGEDLIKAAVQVGAGAFLILGRATILKGWSRLRGVE